MSATFVDEGYNQPQKSRAKAIILAIIIAFCVVAAAAWLVCSSYSENQKQLILNRQRDVQQTILDKSLDAIRVWRVELVDQARFISASEMFRLFITDMREHSPEPAPTPGSPYSPQKTDEAAIALADQRVYMQDLLRDFVKRRSAWNDARIVTLEGENIIASDSAEPLTPTQKDIVKNAVEKRSPVFGPIYSGSGGLVMNMADPLFEVLGVSEQKCVAVLFLTVEMDAKLVSFLTNTSGQQEAIYPRIVYQGPFGTSLMALNGNHVSLRALENPVSDGNLPFALRPALNGAGEVYSIGARPTLLDWLLVLETPAEVLDRRIASRNWEIYGIGCLMTFLLTALAVIIYAFSTNKRHKTEAARYQNLYRMIQQQKFMLDGVNQSLKAGLLLVDDKGDIQVCNPAFEKLSNHKGEDFKGLPLSEALPAPASVELTGKMRNVMEDDQSATVEIELPDQNGEKRLYRVTLFPYESVKGENTSSGSGCVAIFQDITVFRANAKKAAKRQEALLKAMDRALESVDHNLVGQSEKMARVSKLLGEKMNLPEQEKETLRLASLLSQIGKLFVPKELLLKSGGLTQEEKKEVARAPEHADRILQDLHFDLPVRETVREMGERLDGSGPAGYKAEEISRCGRIMAIVNAFIAMTSPRAWRQGSALGVQEAIEQLRQDAKFDNAIATALGEIDAESLKGAIQESAKG